MSKRAIFASNGTCAKDNFSEIEKRTTITRWRDYYG